MAIPLTGTGGLFTILGQMGSIQHDLQLFQSTTLFSDIDTIVSQFNSTAYEDVIATFSGNKFGYITGTNLTATTLQATAAALVNRMVNADVPLSSNSDINLSLIELIRQMVAAAASVPACAVTATSAKITVPTFTGDGVIVLTTKRADGLIQQNIFAEVAPIVCTSDSQTGGSTAGSESFTFSGTFAQPDIWGYNWPLGSGSSAQVTASDGSINSTSTSLLYNGSFELFTSNTPTGWIVVAGVPGTDILRSTNTYDGTYCLEFVGGGTAPNITQLFSATTSALGTIQPVAPLTQYALNFWTKVDVVPAAGVLTIDLIDGSATVINDDSGTANSFAVTLSGVTTSFVVRNGFFRLPRVLPSSIKIRVRLSTGLSAGSALFIDRMCLTPSAPLYDGGPEVAIFSGATPFIQPAGWNITTTNDRAGTTYATTWQTFFNRLFQMSQLNLLLPYSGAPTISDALLT